jgi:hypothetical protein
MKKLYLAFIAFLFALGGPCWPQQLASHVELTSGTGQWSYTLFNDEPSGSSNYISSFTLDVNAPISSIQAPVGWTYSTDMATFIFWSNADLALPYPHDIAPGGFLGDFVLQSSAPLSLPSDFTLLAWDHNQDAPGNSLSDSVLAPSIVLATPEPTVSVALLATLCTFFIVATTSQRCILRRRMSKKWNCRYLRMRK